MTSEWMFFVHFISCSSAYHHRYWSALYFIYWQHNKKPIHSCSTICLCAAALKICSWVSWVTSAQWKSTPRENDEMWWVVMKLDQVNEFLLEILYLKIIHCKCWFIYSEIPKCGNFRVISRRAEISNDFTQFCNHIEH